MNLIGMFRKERPANDKPPGKCPNCDHFSVYHYKSMGDGNDFEGTKIICYICRRCRHNWHVYYKSFYVDKHMEHFSDRARILNGELGYEDIEF